LDFGYASLQVYFDFAPWFLLLLIPAITMRSFADEQAQGTSEILYSLPLSIVQIILGKLVGVFLIILIAIAPTLVYAFVLDQLSSTGGLDWGATMGAYMGLLLLAGTYTIIGLFASSKTKQPIVAFVFSILMAAFVYKGFDWMSTLSFVDALYGYYITQLGMSTHFENMSRGVISAKDIVYFISVIILFVIGCKENISHQKQSFFLFLAIVVSNLLTIVFPFQLDLTKDKRYTLGDTSKQIVQGVAGATGYVASAGQSGKSQVEFLQRIMLNNFQQLI
jgi:ABC-2 type transport system permease protein